MCVWAYHLWPRGEASEFKENRGQFGDGQTSYCLLFMLPLAARENCQQKKGGKIGAQSMSVDYMHSLKGKCFLFNDDLQIVICLLMSHSAVTLLLMWSYH